MIDDGLIHKVALVLCAILFSHQSMLFFSSLCYSTMNIICYRNKLNFSDKRLYASLKSFLSLLQG
jgi:hypothetical protein